MDIEGKEKKRARRLERNAHAREARRRLKRIRKLTLARERHGLHAANEGKAEAGQVLIAAALIDNHRIKRAARKTLELLALRTAFHEAEAV